MLSDSRRCPQIYERISLAEEGRQLEKSEFTKTPVSSEKPTLRKGRRKTEETCFLWIHSVVGINNNNDTNNNN